MAWSTPFLLRMEVFVMKPLASTVTKVVSFPTLMQTEVPAGRPVKTETALFWPLVSTLPSPEGH
jgi:hypothetical protein